MSTPISTLTPASLAQKLAAGATLEELIQDCGQDAQLLAQLLHSKDFTNHLKLRLDLALTQAKLQAAALLPACMANLQTLTTSEKPEVARRATVAIMAIAGLSTTIKPAATAPSSSPAPSSPANPCPANPPTKPTPASSAPNQHNALTSREDRIADQHTNNILDFHIDLYYTHGIDLLAISQHNFPGFTDHLRSFFKPIGITICRHDPNFTYQTSLLNENMVAKAHTYFHHLTPENLLPSPLITFCPGPMIQDSELRPQNSTLNQNPNDSALLPPAPSQNPKSKIANSP